MYWTSDQGDIRRAQMDGSNAVEIVSGLREPIGIAIDYDASRLFWTEFIGNKICSSNLDGADVRTIVTLQTYVGPWGIAVHNNRVYWGNSNGRSLQSSTKLGQNVRTVLKESSYIKHLTTTSRDLPITRQNPCEGQNCSNICVLTTTAFRCIH